MIAMRRITVFSGRCGAEVAWQRHGCNPFRSGGTSFGILAVTVRQSKVGRPNRDAQRAFPLPGGAFFWLVYFDDEQGPTRSSCPEVFLWRKVLRPNPEQRSARRGLSICIAVR